MLSIQPESYLSDKKLILSQTTNFKTLTNRKSSQTTTLNLMNIAESSRKG